MSRYLPRRKKSQRRPSPAGASLPDAGRACSDPPNVATRKRGKELPDSGPFTPTLEVPRRFRVRAGESTKLRVRVDRGRDSMPTAISFAGTPEGICHQAGDPRRREEAEVVVSATRCAAVAGRSRGLGRAGRPPCRGACPSPRAAVGGLGGLHRGRSSWRGRRASGERGIDAAIELDPGHAWAYCFRAITTHLTGRPRRTGRLHRSDPAQAGHRHAYGARGRIRYERGTSPGRWPITTKRSGSSPTTRSPSEPQAGSTPTWASTTVPCPTTAR